MHTEPGPWGPELIGQSRGCSLHVLFMGIRPVKFPQLTEIVTLPLLCAAHSRDLDKWVSARLPLCAPGGCLLREGWLSSLLRPQTSALMCPRVLLLWAGCLCCLCCLQCWLCLQQEQPVRKDPRELHRKSPKHQVSSGHPPSENRACRELCPQHRGDIGLLHQIGDLGPCLVAEMETPKQEAEVGLSLVSVFFLNLNCFSRFLMPDHSCGLTTLTTMMTSLPVPFGSPEATRTSLKWYPGGRDADPGIRLLGCDYQRALSMSVFGNHGVRCLSQGCR